MKISMWDIVKLSGAILSLNAAKYACGQSEPPLKYELSGMVTNEQSIGISDVVVQLFKSQDSSLVKTEITNSSGNYKFKAISVGNYFLKTGMVGYKKYSSANFNLKENTTFEKISLQLSDVALKEVTVGAAKPYIEREHGKVILNVESSINAAGSSAFEVIEKAPGITVNNDNISLRGRQGLIVQIDGKQIPMTGADLANYLRGIPSSAIEKIEIISNPSSKYDAAGISIINIKLKKDKLLGTNGSISLAYGQGRYPKTNNGFTLNHRNKKINVYGNYNYAYRQAFSNLVLKRSFYNGDSLLGAYEQDNYLLFDFRNQIARVGMDYFANKKNTFGLILNGVSNNFNPKGDNVSHVFNGMNINTSRFETQNRSADKWHNYSANFNHKHIFDSLGTELTTDIDFANYGNKTLQNFTTRFYNLSNVEYQNPYVLHGDINGDLKIYAIKSDFIKTLKNKTKLETGLKFSYVKADNNLIFNDKSDGTNRYDSSKSNHFIYTENINAAYFSTSKDWEKITTQFGLRMEHTHVTGKQLVYNSSFNTSYVQLFPSAFVVYTLSKKQSVELTYSRRITRPSYDQLNPFKFFLDPTTYKEGNPYLIPQTTHSLELSHIFNQKITSTLCFGRTLNNITEVIAPSKNELKLTIQTNKNLTMVDVYSFSISAPLRIKKWWNSNNDFSTYYAFYTGNIANTSIQQVGNLTFNFSSVNRFDISKTLSAELSGNYRARELYAYEVVKPIWSVSCGIQKRFWKNNATVKLNVSDIFYTSNPRADVQFTNYKETFNVKRDTRLAVLSFNYKLGKNSIAPSRRRSGGADDIKQRAGGGLG